MFSRSTYDLVFDQALLIYMCCEPITRLTLATRLEVLIGNSGAMIALLEKPVVTGRRFPDNVLIDLETEQPVGLLPLKYSTIRQFGIIETDARRIVIAESLADFSHRLSYENSMELYG